MPLEAFRKHAKKEKKGIVRETSPILYSKYQTLMLNENSAHAIHLVSL
jgi:hypothetical protein